MARGWKVPFTHDGDLLDLAHNAYWDSNTRTVREVQWSNNYEFSDTLTYSGYDLGRSAPRFQFTRRSGATVSFTMAEFNRLIPLMINGHVTGIFTFTKKGTHYSCKLVRHDVLAQELAQNFEN